jgi:hypothetical protein
MRQRGIVRLSLVLALAIGGLMSMLEPRDPRFSPAVDLLGGWFASALLVFVFAWLVLTGIAWAVRGFTAHK